MNGLVPKDFVVCTAVMERIEACPASGVYDLEQSAQQRPTFPMWWGIFVHRFLEYAQTRGREAALAYIAEKFKKALPTCQAIDVASLPVGEVEASFAHNPHTDVARRPNWRKAPTDPWTEVFGKIDLLSSREGRPHVIDYKTGELGPCDVSQHTQLLGIACSVRSPEQPSVDVSLVGVHRTGFLEWRTATVGPVELEAFRARTARLHLRVMADRRRVQAGGRVDFVPGTEQCRWCSLRPRCPAW